MTPAGNLFYSEDTVRLARDGPSSEAATIVRVWHNEEEQMPLDNDVHDELDRPLVEGEYGIEFFPSRRRMIVQGTDLLLVDRSFRLGSLCKHRGGGLLSGVVTTVELELEVQHVLTEQRISQRIPAEVVRPSSCIAVGDHVVHGNWVGAVIEVFVEGMLATDWSPTLMQFARVNDQGLRLGPPMDAIDVQSPFGSSWTPGMLGEAKPRIVELRQTAVCVDWLAINTKLTPEEQQRFQMPKRFWSELEDLTVVRQFCDQHYVVDDLVAFKTPELRDRYGLRASNPGDSIAPVEAMRVLATHSLVTVLWQDGSQSTHSSTDLDQYLEMDEHDVWCGDHVLFTDGDGAEQGAVVQSMDPAERIAQVVPYNRAQRDSITISVLDIKTPGAPDFQTGIGRGQIVLSSSKPNAFAPPLMSRVGAASLDSLSDAEIHEELQSLGERIMRDSSNTKRPAQRMPRMAEEASEINWYGVVSELRLDGKAVVRLPVGTLTEENIERLAIFDDGFDDGTGFFDDDREHDHDMHMFEADAPWTTEDGDEIQGEDWEDVADTNGGDVQEIIVDDDDDVGLGNNGCTNSNSRTIELDDGPCTLFEILEQAPRDHAYYLDDNNGGSGNKQFLSRLQREYKILQSSLPKDILVRAFEDRTDLLRALIVGSPGTPYEDAPFCIDFQLKPSYPQEAPLAFFHSWTGGHGRLSPNLYEDGKICLSVLGTWAGEKSESWDPSKSTLLQVLVSIQGLVLVSEPYFTEPGFERQSETEQGRLNSRHYSERAYVLARRAVLHAVQWPILGLEHEMQKIYMGEGRLQSIIDKASIIVDAAEVQQAEPAAGTEPAPAPAPAPAPMLPVPTLPLTAWGAGTRITKGGAIALRRVLNELRMLHQRKFAELS